MSITYAGITSARARLARLATGLREAAGGEVVARAAAKVADQVRAVAEAKLSRHRLSGEAIADTRVDVVGAMVQLHGMPPANGKAWSGSSYVGLQSWWPFRRGMPPFVVKRAALIMARELVKVLGVWADNTEAADLVSEADAAEVAKVERRARALARPRGRR